MGVACNTKLGPVSTPPLPLNHLSLLDDGRAGGPQLFVGGGEGMTLVSFLQESLSELLY